jgi:predicted GIY-YIG superfamily endonuclease
MIKNPNNDLYVGITEDPANRLCYHNTKRGAMFTKSRSNFNIVFLEEYESLTQARHREVQIKKWRREKKEMLIMRYCKGLPTQLSNS